MGSVPYSGCRILTPMAPSIQLKAQGRLVRWPSPARVQRAESFRGPIRPGSSGLVHAEAFRRWNAAGPAQRGTVSTHS